jgi:RNA polymerase sigma-70 factor, ECF subfamily
VPTLTLAEPSSEELLSRVATGDRDAFSALTDRFLRVVYTEANRVVGDAAAAEDVAQEVFERIWRAAHRFDPDRGSAAAWICTIARNRARDHVRVRRPIPMADTPEVPDHTGPDGDAERGAAALDVHAAVAGLNTELRELIELAYWHGLSQTEIADRTGMPLGTVKTRTRRALARLAEMLGDGDRRLSTSLS